jgi:hypothetical protein
VRAAAEVVGEVVGNMLEPVNGVVLVSNLELKAFSL